MNSNREFVNNRVISFWDLYSLCFGPFFHSRLFWKIQILVLEFVWLDIEPPLQMDAIYVWMAHLRTICRGKPYETGRLHTTGLVVNNIENASPTKSEIGYTTHLSAALSWTTIHMNLLNSKPKLVGVTQQSFTLTFSKMDSPRFWCLAQDSIQKWSLRWRYSTVRIISKHEIMAIRMLSMLITNLRGRRSCRCFKKR
jgi:hypothetical protein